MNILLLAPHPFYQDRGTPIAVNLLLRVLSERGDKVDLVTYHEGSPVRYLNVAIHRILSLPFLCDIPPGFSFKKLLCDLFMFIKVLQLSIKNRYHIVHAVEESVFMAIALKSIFGLPYVYDMDSSMPQQLMEKFPQLRLLNRVMCFFEGRAIRKSEAVIPVCNALAEIAKKQQPKRIMLLPDISLLDEPSESIRTDQIKQRYGIQGLMMMYVGNLERYQGIDLLLESFALVCNQYPSIALVIIGGTSQHIQKYREKALQLRVSGSVYFLGAQPVDQLGAYLAEADILVSPRIQGSNTPMKIYSYLHSGKPLLATDLPTHTQVLDCRVALLAAAEPEAFSEGMMCLLKDKTLRERIGAAGQKLIEENYSFHSFRKKLSGLYEVLEAELVESSCSR